MIVLEVLALKKAMSIWNQAGAVPWRWVIGLAALLGLIAAALAVLPQLSPPVRTPAVVRVKIPAPPSPPPAPSNIAPAPESSQPAAVLSDASARNPGADAMVQPAINTPAVVSGGQTGASVQQAADSAHEAAGGRNDAPKPAPEPNASMEQAHGGSAAVQSAESVEGRSGNIAIARKEAPPALDRSAAGRPPEKEIRAAAPFRKASYTIQVGAFHNKAYADELLDLLRKRGYTPFIFVAVRAHKSDLYTVRFGRFASREAAAEAVSGFKQKENMAAVVAHAGSL
jgi:cell division septation protein DedD